MKQLLTLIFIFLFFICGYSQNQFDPKVIILLPQKINTEKGIDRKIESYERNVINYERSYQIEKKDSLIEDIESNDSIPYNFKVHIVNQIASARHLNFENKMIFDYASTFQTVLALELKNVIVLIDTIESFTGNKNLMKAYAENSKADYIVNIPYIEIKKHKREILIKPKFTVYYKHENVIYDISPFDFDLLNKSYIEIDGKTSYLYFDDVDALSKVLNIIKKNGDRESREKLFNQKLLSNHQAKILDSLFIVGKKNNFIKENFKDSILKSPLNTLYTRIISPNKEHFLAFFVEKKEWNFQGRSGIGDMINVIYGKKINSDWKLNYEEHGNISGGKQTQEENVRRKFNKYFESVYFKEGSTKINNAFWNEKLFVNRRNL